MLNTEMKAAIELLEAIGMKNTTHGRQIKNGTLEFTDPKDKPVKYTLHANGYYRKYIIGDCPYFNYKYERQSRLVCYQLNRTEKIPYTVAPSRWNPQGFTGFTTGRILIPGEYLLMAARIVAIAKRSRKRNKR